jgi:prepilin-type N-terminal cleavage/methylation domain-containing protein
MKSIPQLPKITKSGFTILESLIVVVIVGLAAAASVSMFAVALRGLQDTRQTYSVQAAIEANKTQIDQLARSFTCCSGICTTTPPTTFGANQACATNQPNDDRYYFPQADLASTTTNFPNTTTPSEPNAVDQLCSTANNTNFMTPLKTAIDGLAQPSPATRSNAVILDYKMLRVDFTEPVTGVVVRSLYVKPRMANFCS